MFALVEVITYDMLRTVHYIHIKEKCVCSYASVFTVIDADMKSIQFHCIMSLVPLLQLLNIYILRAVGPPWHSLSPLLSIPCLFGLSTNVAGAFSENHCQFTSCM